MKRPLVMVALLYTGGVLLGDFWPLPLLWLFAFSLDQQREARAHVDSIWPGALKVSDQPESDRLKATRYEQ